MNYQLLYQILSTINQSRTISQVANQLYLSQPYISQVISKSEKKYQVKLVNRSSLPIELTKAGKQLIRRFRETDQRSSHLAAKSFSLSTRQ